MQRIKISPLDISGDMSIDIREVTTDWNKSTVTYNSLNVDDILENEIIDYATVETVKYTSLSSIEGHYVNADITKLVKKWDLSVEGSIPGVLLSAENTTECSELWGTNTPWAYLAPVITIIYKEYNGSESYLTSHSISCGQNAEVSVVDYTGDMVIKQNLFSETGSRLPLDLYATYHSAENTDDNNVGIGWRMSFDKNITLSDGYYIYEDADGVKHYFKAEEGATELYDEDDAGYTLTIDETNSKITIEDSSVIYEFDTVADGETSKVKSETDVDNSMNVITYTYNSSGLLTTIKSTFGTYTIGYATSSYNTSGKCISTIILPDSSKIYCIYYGGTNKLQRFKFANGVSSYFVFNADGTRVGGVNKIGSDSVYNYRVYCDYDSNYKVFKIKEYGYNTTSSIWTLGNYLNISYGTDNTTTFTDKKGRSETYTFDEYGNTITVLNANGYIENTGNSGLSISGGSDSYTKNYIDVSSEPDAIGSGYYYHKVQGTIGSTSSSGGTVTVNSANSYFGGKSIRIYHSEDTQFFTSAVHEFEVGDFAGETVTFSGYIKLKNIEAMNLSGVSGGFLMIKCFNANGTTILNEKSVALTESKTGVQWQRISLTTTIPENTSTFRIFCSLRNAQGKAFFDCLQLEKNPTMNDYNALSNSDFTSTAYWYNEDASAIILNSNGDVEVKGVGGEPAEVVEEEIIVEETTDNDNDTTTFASEFKKTDGYGIVRETDKYGNITRVAEGVVGRTYERIYEVTEATESSSVTDGSSSVTTQETVEEITANKFVYQTIAVNKANVNFVISGTAKAKSVPLNNKYRSFGIALKITYALEENETTPITEEHYQEFNCATTIDQNVCMTVYPEISDKVIETVVFAFVYGYNKNVMTVKNAMLNFAFVYNNEIVDNVDINSNKDEVLIDSVDNYIEQTIKNEYVSTSEEYIESSNNYDDTGNFIVEQIEATGKTTKYTYNSLGYRTSITDGNNNKTSYGYDSVGNLVLITSGANSNTYTYDNFAHLSAINHNGFSYKINYDIYNQVLSTKIGDQTLATNTYQSGNGLLLSTTYGNGDVISYTYDDYDRVISVSNETEKIIDYFYNKKGLVTKVYDYALEQTINYQYDCIGQLVAETAQTSATNSDGDSVLVYNIYTDTSGNTIEKTNINGTEKAIVRGTTSKSFEAFENVDADEGIDEFVKFDNVTVTSELDKFGRVSFVDTSYNSGGIEISPVDVFYDYLINPPDEFYTESSKQVKKITYVYNENVNSSSEYKYAYDSNDNISQIMYREGDTEDLATIAEYSYDSFNQLSIAKDVNADTYTEYTYDNAGNITAVKTYALNDDLTKGSLQSTNTYSYDSVWKDKLASYTENGTTNTFTYDEIGNPINYRDSMVMSWENGRQLSTVTKGEDTIEFKYNVKGMRIYKKTGEYEFLYYYDSENNLIALEVNQDTVLYFYYDSNNSVTSMSVNKADESSKDLYFFIKNQQGDIEKIVNSQGNVVVDYTYDVWGRVLDVIDNSGINLSELNPYRYRGYVYDAETGLYYVNSRYYDPQTGRYINIDDSFQYGDDVLDCNMFIYCNNNPVNFISTIENKETEVKNTSSMVVKTDNAVLYDVPLYDQNGYSLCWAFCHVMIEDYRKGIVSADKEALIKAVKLSLLENYVDSISKEPDWNDGGGITGPNNSWGYIGTKVDSIEVLYEALLSKGPFFVFYDNIYYPEKGHVVVITGVDLENKLVYTNNPWKIRGVQSFDEFMDGFAEEDGKHEYSDEYEFRICQYLKW